MGEVGVVWGVFPRSLGFDLELGGIGDGLGTVVGAFHDACCILFELVCLIFVCRFQRPNWSSFVDVVITRLHLTVLDQCWAWEYGEVSALS